ncbi:MAG: peptidoglycan-associated lipoprotein Pal [Burkholderiales bacterium]|nr:peptidoglycan-associated lipoprotein Pal [Sulfuricellaceae bacterium]
MKKVALSLMVLSLLAGCASQGVTDKKAAVEDHNVGANANGVKQSDVSANPLHDPNNILSKRSVYYDFDKYDVKAEYKPMVEAHAKYLTSHGDAKATLQGNTDERGSREYNLALGQRRADGVRKMMNAMGVANKQVEAVSFGEEKPKSDCHDESCWKENRRTDIVYQGE